MNEPIAELDVVALLSNIPAEGLVAGQTGTVVFVHDGGAAYEVEFILRPRRSVVTTVRADQLLKLKGLSAA